MTINRYASLGVLLTLLAVPAAGQTPAPNLELAVSLSKPTFMVGEPVMLRLALTNRSAQAAQLRAMSIESQTMRYAIRAGDGEWRPYEWPQAVDPRMPVGVSAGGALYGNQLFQYDYRTSSLAFPAPGRYSIRAEYVGFFTQTPSAGPAEVTFQVVAPPAAETEGSALFARRDVSDFLGSMTRQSEVVQRLQAFVDANPRSPFAAYARYYLGIHAAANYQDKPADYELSSRLFREADQDTFQLRSMALIGLAQSLTKAGNTREAATVLDRVIASDARSFAGQRARELRPAVAGPGAPRN